MSFADSAQVSLPRWVAWLLGSSSDELGCTRFGLFWLYDTDCHSPFSRYRALTETGSAVPFPIKKASLHLETGSGMSTADSAQVSLPRWVAWLLGSSSVLDWRYSV